MEYVKKGKKLYRKKEVLEEVNLKDLYNVRDYLQRRLDIVNEKIRLGEDANENN